ncbi:hypothetical protein N0V82_002945 [Gnomoniopsis sp. IMI 355080]|nr:hypothetical protein N0V82_002945 [Gnomoniopsis sp. IMI 355080]
MTWARAVLTAYCEHTSLQQDEEPSLQFRSAEMILRHHCWLGRARGLSAHNTHQRHMVPLCTRPTPGCVVLFMPYLSWETAKHHAEAKVVIQSETDSAMTYETGTRWKPLIRSMTGAVAKTMHTKRVPRSPLGQLFLDVASLHQAMCTYDDRKLLKTKLHYPASLHPRRSLDQAQYGDEDSAKDKDQVVYRATNVIKEYQRSNPGDKVKIPTKPNFVIPGTAKLIMVDQLWMWILDNHTVVTAFPKRWGSTRGDASDVHQAIRNRMQLRSTRDWNAFDIGLIIIEECADALFNESLISQRPQVLDIFAEALGFARRRQTQSLKRILYWSNAAARMRKVNAAKDILDLQLPLFDIGSEAALQMEINDITDELQMMIQIFKTQQGLLGSFRDQGQLELRKSHGNYDDLTEDQRRFIDQRIERFRLAAKEILERFDDRIRNLEELRDRAQNVSDSVNQIRSSLRHGI